MRLGRKLALFLLLAAVAPLAGVGFALLARVQRTLGARIAAEQRARADTAAATIAEDLERTDRELSALVRAWPPDRLTEAELQRLLFLLSQQVSGASAAAVVDAGGSVRAVVDGASPSAGGASTDAFLAAVRAAAADAGAGLALAVYDDPGGGPLVAAVRSVPAAEGRPWLLGARLGPERTRSRIDAAAGAGGGAWLLDARGAPLVASSSSAPLSPEDRAELAAGLAPGQGGALQGRRLVAGWSPLANGTGWGVLAALPTANAYADVVRTRREVLAASAAVLALVLVAAALLARHLGAGLARLDAAARALGQGDLAVRLPVRGADEVAAVSATFNGMAEELSSARARLERWNEDLRREVEARTRDLERAHERLLEAQKLAALGRLGAGVAHEINNPLAGILGNAQLLLEEKVAGDPDRPALAKIEELARRCRDVVKRLLRFSQQGPLPDLREVDLSAVVEEALALSGAGVADGGVPVSVELARPGPRVRGDPGHLARVVLDLVWNARTACEGRPGARIRVATACDAGGARIVVEDDGKGIAAEDLPRLFEPFFTRKARWTDVGLGLSVAYGIVAAHGGRIDVASRAGEGSTFTVSLPAARTPTV
jgi:two-component system, NtrC family, sensor kinase